MLQVWVIRTPLNRQAFITFGDASWGSVKVGKDLGIFAGDAILTDMTLLGVGGGVQGVDYTRWYRYRLHVSSMERSNCLYDT